MRNLLKIHTSMHWWICFTSICAVSLLSFFTFPAASYRTVALLLMLNISILAMFCSVWPVIVSAILSAAIWNFFFIPPTFTFAIQSTEDTLMFLMYFVIALINTVLSTQISRERKKLQKKEEEAMAIKLYNTVFNSLSHELKTPIAAILGSVEIMNDKGIFLNELQQKELVSEIEIAGNRLNNQIEDLLHMSRLDSGILRPQLDWVDLEEILYQVIHELQGENRIILHLPSNLPLLKSDQAWLKVIVANLIKNAMKYSPSSEKVIISVKITNNELRIDVHDKGEGISNEEQMRIFDKFYRTPKTVGSGTGIGLSLVKGYTEALHGTVLVKNHNDGGAVFTILLPAETNYLNHIENE